MSVKKFICTRCGAPKLTPYHSPYVVCDFCSNLIDIDYASGYKVWTTNPETVSRYQNKKMKIEAQLNTFVLEKKQAEYEKLQYEYWDYYYKAFPHYLPPTVNTPDIYAKYLEAAAKMNSDYVFNGEFKQTENAYTKSYNALKYYSKNDKNYVTWETFEPMIKNYIKLTKDSFRTCYDNPAYEIMHKVLPEDLHFKLKISQIAQVWTPYLEGEYAERFLEMVNLKYEYTNYSNVKGENKFCTACAHEQFIPANSIEYNCESCHTINVLKTKATCSSCGNEMQLPKNWTEYINCNSCKTNFRVVTALFG